MVKKGYKQTEVGVIPEKWKDKKLGDVGKVCMCKRIFANQTSNTGEVPFFKIGTFGKEADAYISKGLYEDYKQRFSYPQKGDVLISAAGTLGRTIVFEGKDAYFQDSNIVWLDTDKELLCNEYLYHYYKVIKWGASEGSTIARLYNGIICNTHIALPDVEEQKQIATVLSELDELMSLTEKQISKKKAIKQGTMQELLTGKKRLPGFSGDWIKSNIGSCIIEKPSYGINAPAVDFNGFLPRYIRITDISKDGRYCKDAQASVSAENVEPFLLKTNDIVLARTGASVGKSYIYDEHDGRLVYAGFLIKMSIDPQKADSRFIFGVLHTYDYWKWVAQTSMRSGQPGINGEEYASYEFRMPSDLKEQKAIADILTNMDNEIVTLWKKLIKYRQVKQGMMQQLLTGKIRLV